MTLKRPPGKTVRILLALVFIVGMTAAFSAATEQHALALSCNPGITTTKPIDGVKVTTLTYTFGATCYNDPVDHQCVDMGGHGGVDAIECADIEMSFSPTGLNVWGVGEYYCQGPFGYKQCAAMSVDQVFYFGAFGSDPNGVSTYGHPGGYYTCSGSGCPTNPTPRAMVGTYHFSGSLGQAGGTCSYIMFTSDEVANSITVPDGTKITDPISPATTRNMQVCFE
jgi:hypothetical protein